MAARFSFFTVVCKQGFRQSENIPTTNSLSFYKFAKIKMIRLARKRTDSHVFGQLYPLQSLMLQTNENVIRTCLNKEMIVL